MQKEKLIKYDKKYKVVNRKNYVISTILILLLYFLLSFSIKDEGIFSYKAGIYINVLIYILFALSLNVTSGIMGELNLGHAGFISVGAYFSAIFSKYLIRFALNESLHLVLACILGGIFASIFGFFIGLSAFRLKGDYLAIITLAFGEILKYIIQNIWFLGGAAGLNGIPIIAYLSNTFWIVIVSSTILIMILISQKGRKFLSIRENEIAAENMGVNVKKVKVYAFVLSAFFAGVGGSLFAHSLGSLTPDKFNFVFSIEILVMVVLGGLGSITGSVVSATFLTLLNEILRQASEYRFLIYSLILIFLMLFKKDGLLGINEFTIGGCSRFIKKIKKKVIN